MSAARPSRYRRYPISSPKAANVHTSQTLRNCPEIALHGAQRVRRGARIGMQADCFGERLGDELANGDHRHRRSERNQDRVPPRARPAESNGPEAAFAQADGKDAEHEQNWHLVRYEVKHIVPDDDEAADCQLEKREPSPSYRADDGRAGDSVCHADSLRHLRQQYRYPQIAHPSQRQRMAATIAASPSREAFLPWVRNRGGLGYRRHCKYSTMYQPCCWAAFALALIFGSVSAALSATPPASNKPAAAKADQTE